MADLGHESEKKYGRIFKRLQNIMADFNHEAEKIKAKN